MKNGKKTGLFAASILLLILFSGCSLLLPNYLFINDSSYNVEVDIIGEDPFTVDSGDEYRHYSMESSLRFYYTPTDTVTYDAGVGVITFKNR